MSCARASALLRCTKLIDVKGMIGYEDDKEEAMSRKPNKSAERGELQLGRAVAWPERPEAAQIDRVPNPQKDTDYLVRFTVPEFTSTCPVPGQPDFAHLVIDYAPGQWLLESKSLKLYAASFR